jgi:hypothetical protein
VDAEGIPLADIPIVITAPSSVGGEPQTVHVQTNADDGHITMANALVPGRYPELTFSATVGGTQLQGRVDGVEIVGDGITDLGVIRLEAVPEDTVDQAANEG